MKKYIFIACIFLIVGCSSNPQIAIVEQLETAIPPGLAEETIARPMALSKVMFDMKRGSVVGETSGGNLCVFPKPLKWSNDPETYEKGQFHLKYKEVMKKYNYPIPEAGESLFSSYTPQGDEFILAAKVYDVKLNRCTAYGGFAVNKPIFKANISFKVTWEIYSVEHESVIFVFENSGYDLVNEFTPKSDHNYYTTAFARALEDLLAHPEVGDLITYKKEISPNKVKDAAI